MVEFFLLSPFFYFTRILFCIFNPPPFLFFTISASLYILFLPYFSSTLLLLPSLIFCLFFIALFFSPVLLSPPIVHISQVFNYCLLAASTTDVIITDTQCKQRRRMTSMHMIGYFKPPINTLAHLYKSKKNYIAKNYKRYITESKPEGYHN